MVGGASFTPHSVPREAELQPPGVHLADPDLLPKELDILDRDRLIRNFISRSKMGLSDYQGYLFTRIIALISFAVIPTLFFFFIFIDTFTHQHRPYVV